MDILTLCREINLQKTVKNQVLAFADQFDFQTVDRQLKGFLVYESMKESLTELQAVLGEEDNHIPLLACMLKASADAYNLYQAKGICDEIYFATMKCYTRFIHETFEQTGRFYFDRYWWTTRQAGCHLFRIGSLEYEKKPMGDQQVIALHIPSDADLSPSAVEQSITCAEEFFHAHYPEMDNAEYCCNSWLLDPQLNTMLTAKSNILAFQKRFELSDQGKVSMEFMKWIFRKKTTDYLSLPENTSLQRAVKKHLLSGGVIRDVYGKWKS